MNDTPDKSRSFPGKLDLLKGLSFNRFLLFTGIILANYGIDRLTKILAQEHLQGAREPLRFLGNLMVWTYIENEGAFLGMGGDWPYLVKLLLFILLPLLACLAGFVYVLLPSLSAQRLTPGMSWAALCLIGGGVGNLHDRIIYDFRVVDFLNFGIGSLRTGILNVADLSITFGALALLVLAWRKDKRDLQRQTG